MINTREELCNALCEAAELEHGLLVQYLFAAFSMKRRLDEGITPMQQLLMSDWEQAILKVAHQEMYHLANVCNLLSAIGGAPQFQRPNFPQSVNKYYPFDFELERFSDSAMYRFIVFELPEGEKPPQPPIENHSLKFMAFQFTGAPDPIVYNHIGELYKQIAEGFKTINEKELFIGPKGNQDTDDWSLRLKLFLVVDRRTALNAIDQIVLEGEGSPTNRVDSHYDKFLKLRQALQAEILKDPTFDPSRPVVVNPQTRVHRGTVGKTNVIVNKVSLKVAELFNSIYSSMLMAMTQYYSYSGESIVEREMLRDSSRRLMSAVIRPIAEMLTEMPFSDDPNDGNAGPGFELYGPLSLANTKDNRATILFERVNQHIADVEELLPFQTLYPVLSRLRRTKEALEGTRLNLHSVFN